MILKLKVIDNLFQIIVPDTTLDNNWVLERDNICTVPVH